jgi:DNA uptake protein ComE-like DNA-binding protein
LEAQTGGTVAAGILQPMLDAQGRVIRSSAPDGKRYPVFRPADESALTQQIRAVLDTGFAQQVLRLDRYARNLLRREAGRGEEERLKAPMYLLLSGEEGGFARNGFWLQDQSGGRRLVWAGYVDLVVDEEAIADGNLEEIFSHEVGHLILKSLLGDISSGPSPKMHQSMTVTDYLTAFDEGYAEHFQPLVRDATSNAYLRELNKGATPTDSNLLWLSRLDQQLRTDGVKRNLFVHRKALPLLALQADPDRYQLFLDGETSVDFLSDEFKNAQEMMACEGVIATLFYRLVNDQHLRDHYREEAFYRQFLGPAASGADVRKEVSPYENVNLKLFAAMRRVGLDPAQAQLPSAIRIVKAYASLFPEEAQEIYGVFLKTTYGVTASQELGSSFELAASAGRRGDIVIFRQRSGAAFALLRDTIQQVARGQLALEANLGPELWVLNSSFKIAPAVWVRERTEQLALNLNTAGEAELMTLPGVDQASARRIVAERRARGFYRSLDELCNAAGLSPALYQSLAGMSEQMEHQKGYTRP